MNFINNKDDAVVFEWTTLKPDLKHIAIMHDLKLLSQKAEHEIAPDIKVTPNKFEVAILDIKLAV